MMGWFAEKLLRSKATCLLVVALVLGLAAWCATHAVNVGQDDDLLAFLPADNPQVIQFREISERFGSLDVAIVGLEAGDPFAAEFVEDLGTLTRRLNEEADIAFAMSLNNVEDFEKAEEGGIKARYLMREPPKNEKEKQELRELVLSKRHIVGNLVAADGKSVIVLAFLAPGTNPRQSAALIRNHVTEVFPETPTYWGGAPFISTYIYDVTQRDMARLIPWAVALIILIIVASFRDVLGALLALGSTGVGIVYTYGLMGMRGINANIVLSAMPVILFAVGSAYAIHIMVRYYALRADREPDDAMIDTLKEIGPTVLAAGLTTVAGLLSFMAMDIEPMQQFGLYTGIGIFSTLVLSVTFVPAVVRLIGVKARSFEASIYERVVTRLIATAREHRRGVIAVLAVVLVAGGALTSRVEARMENAAFFAEGSPPDRAERFMRDHFGGSLFIQVMVEGDMNDPAVLREVQRIADFIAVQPHVSSVNHIGLVLSLAYEALDGERRLPTTTEQVRWIYRYLAGRPAIDQLLHPERQHALIHAKIDTDDHEAVETLLKTLETMDAVAERSGPSRVALRLCAELHDQGVSASPQTVGEHLAGELGEPDRAGVEERLSTYLTSAESLLDKRNHHHAEALASAYASLDDAPSDEQLQQTARRILAPPPTLSEACEKVAAERAQRDEDEDEDEDEPIDEEATDGDDEEEDECTPILDAHDEALADADALADVIGTRLSDARRREAAHGAASTILKKLGAPTDLEVIGIAGALMDVKRGDSVAVAHQVSGVPVLYRGLSRSVTQNQFKSLGMALALVLIIMIGLFRSVVSGMLAAAPTVITLLGIYGLMGAVGMHLDIGTSMLASIIIGAGVDYAVHLMAAWRGKTIAEAGQHAGRHAGPAITTNALMVAAGFFVLTLGDAVPLQNVGRLTAAAMIIAGLATFVAVPALARKTSYGRSASK